MTKPASIEEVEIERQPFIFDPHKPDKIVLISGIPLPAACNCRP
jgi:hypothetical protein